MRWKFPNQSDAAEEAQRSRIIGQMDAWWAAFRSKAPDIDALFSRKQSWDLADWMHKNLNTIDSRLMWEYGPGLSGGHRLVITPESERGLRPLVDVTLQRAPKIPGWEFYVYRLPENIEGAVATVKARTKGDIARTRFGVLKGRNNCLDLVFASPDYNIENGKQAEGDCFVATETLLGEEVLDKWIGCIDVRQQHLNSPDFQPLDQLLPEVRRQIDEVMKSLPDNPCFEINNTATWTMYKLKPEKAPDYPAQLDMFVGRTILTEMWMCAHSNQLFDSSRFSKHGELFAYIKLDGSNGVDEEKFKDKAEIEDAIDEVIVPEKLGSVVGGGTGWRYSYIDLALMNPKAAIEKIKVRLRAGNIPKRSWILFFDDYLQDEWIGIWDDSPPPPR